MQTFVQDLRYGARMLLKKTDFTIVAAITLPWALGPTAAQSSASSIVFCCVRRLAATPSVWR
ncbi:MAG: hypothetical protein J2P21_17590 [Chloracidobacterium sp.]|nr:hypothetical protein [Chloracidobacterium sp.]